MADGTNTFIYSYNQFNYLENIKKNGTINSTFSYDANGNQIKEVTKTDVGGTIKDITTDYIYDKADRLSKVTISDGTTTKNTENFYNGDGQRIKQNEDGLITKYYYDDGNLLYTTDENNSKAEENILDPNGVIVASKRFDGIYKNMYFFYNYDIRSSVTNIINPDGQIVKGYDYDEFGGTKEKGDYAFKNDVKFTGAVHDKSANLYYMNARFYNPNTGRFITEDTYSGNAYEPWTQHLYAYTVNNPVNFIDPTGHRPMYAMNPEDETDVQRSTSLNTMKGYSGRDSYDIATAKTPKEKKKATEKAEKNKAKKAQSTPQIVSNAEVQSEGFDYEKSAKGNFASGVVDKFCEYGTNAVFRESKVWEDLGTWTLGRYVSSLGKGSKVSKKLLGAAGTIAFASWNIGSSLSKGEYVGAAIDLASAAAGFGAGCIIGGIGTLLIGTFGLPALAVGAVGFALTVAAGVGIEAYADSKKKEYYGR